MKNLLDDLNESQQEAVKYFDGPSLVIAGAGSGKTRVLTYKIAYLMQMGLAPWNILALTFTNKAAREMKERIAHLVGADKARYLNMGTFHSIFSHILRAEAQHINFTSQFTIYDESDSRSLIKSIVKEMNLDDKIYRPAEVHSRISMAKNHLILPEQYSKGPQVEHDQRKRMPDVWKIYNAYCQRCQKSNAMDFDDLLVNTWKLFSEHDDVCEKYASHFQFVLVDEYQDTNFVQQSILFQLTKGHQHICVVGDDYQSIYGFRGANIDNILEFKNIYSSPKLFKLERNYRSTQNIVAAANSLMKHNERQIPKDVYSENDEGRKILYKPTYSDREEASLVCKEIKRIRHEEGCPYSDFAILYRTNSQSRSFEDEMLKQNIPYRVFGGLSFYQRKEIKDVIAYFRLVENVDDEEAFKRIINYPARGIGNTTLQKISLAAVGNGVSFWEVLSSPVHYGLDVNKGTLAKLDCFRQIIEAFREHINDMDAAVLGKMIVKETGIADDIYSGNEPEDKSRQENIDELISSLTSFVDDRREEGNENVFLADYLQDVSLQTDFDSDSDSSDDEKVLLMTVHSAKGLEFPTVFVVGLDENIFPSQMSLDSSRQLEEERRLLYVAITRAEKRCLLTSAQNRYRYGKAEFFVPSRFLKDIDPHYIEKEDMASAKSRLLGSRGFDDVFSFPWDRQERSRSWRDDNYQNSRPAASQFRADSKRKITSSSSSQQRPPLGFRKVSIHAGTESAGNASSGSSSISTPSGTLYVGSVIEHQRFGIGKVLCLEGSGENAKATVEFRNSGSKQLLLKFAKFDIVE